MKKADRKYIKKEEKEFLGFTLKDRFKGMGDLCGYESTEVELLSATDYEDWINGAFYSCFATWDQEPGRPVRLMMKNLSFEEKEKKVKHMLKQRPISAALESSVFNFRISGVPRTFLAQITRHRAMSFGVQSLRVNSCYSNDVRVPELITPESRKKYNRIVFECKGLYRQMIEEGVPMEQARLIMPLGTTTTMSAVMRLRDVMQYVRDRSSAISQDEHTQVVAVLLKELKTKQPKYYELMKSDKTEALIQEYVR